MITIYRVLLDSLYITAISPFFSYDSLIINRNDSVYIASWGILWAFTWLVYPFLKKDANFTSFVVVMLFLLKVIPFTSFIACNAQPWDFILLQTIYWFLIFVLLRLVPPFRIPNLGRNTLFIDVVTFIFIVDLLYWTKEKSYCVIYYYGNTFKFWCQWNEINIFKFIFLFRALLPTF